MGALDGVKVVEIGGLGPAPFCAMVLADHGADVLRVERPNKVQNEVAFVHDDLVGADVMSRGRQSVGIDLKHPDGAALLRELAAGADVLIEGFRPGVAERLGIGPDDVRTLNPGLVYGRMTGWGRSGPLADRAGHDINYVALAGAQAHIGRVGQPPTPPLNLVGDFGGGGLLLAFGICAALLSRASSGEGQVVDAAMIDGAALLMAPLYGAHGSGFWSDERGTNLLDSGAPFYDCYECADGGWMSVGALEPQFYAALLATLGLDDGRFSHQHDQSRWPELRGALTTAFGSRPRSAWVEAFDGVDACVAPVLTMGEAPDDPHHVARGTFIELGGFRQPAPAPRFSGTPAATPTIAQMPAANTDEALRRWGVDDARLTALRESGAIG